MCPLEANPAIAPAKSWLRLLIVEDSAADAELAVALLKRVGYCVAFSQVTAPEQFRERLESDEYDLVLADHNLGSWTGLNALQLLQQLGRDIPFVVVTGVLGDEAAVEYIKRGAADYVLKHRLERLPVVVSNALREQRFREEAARLRDAIRAAKQELERTFDSVPDPVLVLDAAGHVRRANHAAAEVLGLQWPAAAAGDYREAFGELAVLAGQGGDSPRQEHSVARRWEIQLRDLGVTFDAVRAPLRASNGAPRGFVQVLRDITERKRYEAALEQNEKSYRELFEEAPAGYQEIDHEGIVRRVNRYACELLGVNREEVLGHPAWDLAAPEAREACREALRRSLAGEQPPGAVQREYLRRDGCRLTVQVRERPIRDAAGQVVGIRSVWLELSGGNGV